MNDFLSITETPGALLNAEQMGRMTLRYSLAAELAAGRRVLEVSCGAGVGLNLLAAAAGTLAACDYAASVLPLAQQATGAHVPLAAADAQALPYAAAAFDLILCFEAIYYLPRPAAFLHECRRLLAAGGQLLLSTSNPEWPYFVPGALSVHYPTVTELAALLDAAGFAPLNFFGSLPVTETRGGRPRLRARARQQLLRIGWLRRDNRLTRALKRAGYGALTPLPASLAASQRVAAPFAQLTPLPVDRPDRRHRVLFVVAAQR